MKQNWTVTIDFIETMGDETSNHPWYSPRDMKEIIRLIFETNPKMRDLNLVEITASEKGQPYYGV